MKCWNLILLFSVVWGVVMVIGVGESCEVMGMFDYWVFDFFRV